VVVSLNTSSATSISLSSDFSSGGDGSAPVYHKHNMNLAVLIFLKTYVCKHESKHEI
jgi:hypothetical protein